MTEPLRIGLLLENTTLLASYKKVVSEQGYLISAVVDCSSRDQIEAAAADAWLVVLKEDMENPTAEAWLKGLNVPVIFDDSLTQTDTAWHRKLSDKLQQIPGMVNLNNVREKPEEVWVLAASTGGPAAVKAFLKALPERLNVAFIYAQHIDQGFDATLAQAISKGSFYPAVLAENGSVIASNSVLILRPEQQAEVFPNGTLVMSNKPWSGIYKPAINQIVANVASVYGAKAGVIIFTGMGDDGKAAVRMMHQQGGTVWTQTAASCTISSMPDQARATGVVELEADPEALAEAFVARRRKRRIN